MRPLPFRLPDVTRVAWASPAARALWEPRFDQMRMLMHRLEREAVIRGRRAAALQTVTPGRMADLVTALRPHGLTVLPLGNVAGGSYAGEVRLPTPADGAFERIAVVRHADAGRWMAAWSTRDDNAIGALLGYPACCRATFLETWAKGDVDPTWTQGRNARPDAPWPVETNVLARWVGVRAVPHLPCAFDCDASVALGQGLGEAATDIGEAETWAALLDVLRWPTAWSALHGIAEIVTPVYRIVTRTNATADRLDLRLEGCVYPELGAAGLRHPFRAQAEARDTWTANGFTSAQAMRDAHDVLLEAVRRSGTWPASALDLGCGNGVLVRRLAPKRKGIDRVESRVAEAKRLDPAGIYEVGDVADDGWNHRGEDLTVLMPGRLLEMSSHDREWVAESLAGCRVLFYAYRDWLSRFGGLEALIAAAGFKPLMEQGRAEGPTAAAVVGICPGRAA